MKRIAALSLAIVFTALSVSGCSGLFGNKSKDTGSNSDSTQPTATTGTTNQSSADSNQKSVWNMVMYLPDNQGMYVQKKKKEIQITGKPDINEKAKMCIQELINSSATSIPKETNVLSSDFSNGTLTINLSKEFEQKHVGGSTGVNMTMAPLVLTLTELEGVKQVAFKIDGKVLNEFKGHIEFSKPFKRSEYEQFISK